MPKLTKNVVALTVKFDCDRFLRFRLASADELRRLNISDAAERRPGTQLIALAGSKWEADTYDDLIYAAGNARVAFTVEPNIDPNLGRTKFKPIADVFSLLQTAEPPIAIIEGEFEVPSDIARGLKDCCEKYGLEKAKARPDVMWIRRYPTGAPLIHQHVATPPSFEIHIVDIKLAGEPSIKHFIEVTYYALGLAKALEEQGLSPRYAVSAEGFIWPGSDNHAQFRTLFDTLTQLNSSDPLTEALLQTLRPVPYEVYQLHLKEFLDIRLPAVLAESPENADWHVEPKCKVCDFLPYCITQADRDDHLSRIPWLSSGQMKILKDNGIDTTRDLLSAIEGETPQLVSAMSQSHQLRGERQAILARVRALNTNSIQILIETKCALMPAWSDLSIFLTIHFDPGTEIAFALGAFKVLFEANRQPGDLPKTEEFVVLVDQIGSQQTSDIERSRLFDFIDKISSWLLELSDSNCRLAPKDQLSAHIFFWDSAEVHQLRRMLARHMAHSDFSHRIDVLSQLFPPDEILPDPEPYKSQPGTIVKDVIRHLVGLPIPHSYTLLSVANCFFPPLLSDGQPFQYTLPYGFSTPLSDQIPLERAYELWRDKSLLPYPKPRADLVTLRKYTRTELCDALTNAVSTRLKALSHVVRQLRKHCRSNLIMQKSGFTVKAAPRPNLPAAAIRLIAFEKLNSICSEIENRRNRALPIEEREARFLAIRGIRLVLDGRYDDLISQIVSLEPRFSRESLLPFHYSPSSKDAKIRERDFLLVLSNEDTEFELDMTWRGQKALTLQQTTNLLESRGLNQPWVQNARISRLVQVTLVHLESSSDAPFLILQPNDVALFQLAQDLKILDLGRTMVLDSIFQDFSVNAISESLFEIGGRTLGGGD